MNEMNTDELRDYTSETEAKIRNILNEYQDKANIFVGEIKLIHIKSIADGDMPVLVKVDLFINFL